MSNPDAIYWRRTRWDPWREYARLENLWFWPGEGLCVDGYIYWFNKKNPAYVCRLPMDEWILRGRRKRAPPSERPFPDVHQERLVPIRDWAVYIKKDGRLEDSEKQFTPEEDLDEVTVIPHEPEAKA